MVTQSLLSRITINPEVMVGKPVIRRLRITVEQIPKALANKVPVEDILQDYAELEFKDIQAVLASDELVSQEKFITIRKTIDAYSSMSTS